MIRNFRRTAAVLAAGAIALTAPAALAAPAAGSADVSASGDSIFVEGELAEALGAIVIGTDANGDAVGSGLGVDIVEYSISFPNSRDIEFHLAIGDANPGTGYFPQGTQFEITPSIGAESLALTADANLDEGISFGAQTCTPDPDTGVTNCTTSDVPGSYEDGVLTWRIRNSAAAGTQINGGGGEVNPTVGTGTTGGLQFNGGLIDILSISSLANIPTATLIVDGQAAASARLGDGGYDLEASGFAAGEHAVSVELTDAAGDSVTVDLGTVTTS